MPQNIHQLASDLQDALGIEGGNVSGFTFEVSYECLPTLVVRRIITDTTGIRKTIAQNYELVPRASYPPLCRNDGGAIVAAVEPTVVIEKST